MNKWILSITFLFLGFILGLGLYLVLPQKTVNVSNNNVMVGTSTEIEKDIGGQLIITKEIQEANLIAKKVPANWGELVAIETIKGTELLRIIFNNKVRVIFQPGVQMVYWEQMTDSGDCDLLMKKYNTEKEIGGECAMYKSGFFDLNTKQVKEILLTDASNYLYGRDKFPERYNFFELGYDRSKTAFSPEGNYLAFRADLWEGCGTMLISTKTGQPLSVFNTEDKVTSMVAMSICNILMVLDLF